MTPGKITTKVGFFVKLTIVSDRPAINEEIAKTKTDEWVARTLNDSMQKLGELVTDGTTARFEVVPRSHMLYDLRGLPPE